MAKDDYFVIVAKILTFLYRKLKGKDNRGVLDYIRPGTDEFPIESGYMEYIVSHMYEAELIERVYCMTNASGEVISIELTEDSRITPEGITYLNENSMIRKTLKAVPALAAIIAG